MNNERNNIINNIRKSLGRAGPICSEEAKELSEESSGGLEDFSEEMFPTEEYEDQDQSNKLINHLENRNIKFQVMS